MAEIIPHWLDKQADLAPEEVAVQLAEGKSITFQQLKNESHSYAKKLLTQGVKRGDHVAILSQNCYEMVVAIHALSYVGAVVVLLNTRLTSSEISYQLHDAHASLIITQPALLEKARQAVTASRQNMASLAFSEIAVLQESDRPLRKEINLDDIFTIIYTSGTTGFPKGVMHTYGNHWWSAISSALNLGLQAQDKWLAVLPLFHVGGLSILIKSVVYGMSVYLFEKFEEQTVHRAIVEQGVTMASVVTVMLDRLLEVLGEATYPEQFRCMLLGGGPVPKPLLEQAKTKHIPVFQTYGMTETSSQIVTLSPKHALDKLGSAGKALLPAQIKIVQNEKSASANDVGEIFVKGPMVTSGYYANDAANEKAFSHGWLATGDLGYIDEDGFLYVMDRRKDLIVSGGENIYPAEVESVLAGLDDIVEAGVVGKADNRWGQVPVAFVVRKTEQLTAQMIINYCTEHLAKYKVPKEVYFVDELPRNASNKLQRYQLLEWLKGNLN